MTESPISPNEPPGSLGPAEIRSSQPSRFFVVSRLARLCRKELREILRDRRTIVTLVLMPLLLYPVLSLIFNKLLVSQFNPSTAPIDILVGFESELQANEFMSLVREGEAALSAMGIAVDPETSPQFKLVEAKEAEIAVKDGIIDVGIFQNDPQSGAEEETSNPLQNNSKWELLYRPNLSLIHI